MLLLTLQSTRQAQMPDLVLKKRGGELGVRWVACPVDAHSSFAFLLVTLITLLTLAIPGSYSLSCLWLSENTLTDINLDHQTPFLKQLLLPRIHTILSPLPSVFLSSHRVS